ncbi:MAG TPA: flagellar biosynthesis anti-sigma factor FlgM [Anaerolinea thermolimosa]|uniref:Negative regulator of flagellin synthesis n=1 Tax=Anaerolinea thermolimosa TaxID=229919 RepID=A0A3D1JCM2_9CHLR|nr:flagellar biosynthesis anti-sigma factor FlgM [Anaerolinea thermolimosa]GAP07901.1 anti-sigma-28 factor, FlgM family [Anaerolinea thermolimosa]HCE16282.1 flagellar biosynthesis anti-sigma factor FlgM [Anaerolinea thermolimosa]
MKIENNGISSLSSSHQADSARQVDHKGGNREVELHHLQADRAELSERARVLARARATAENGEPARQERVEEIRRQVESGDYTVQVEEIARRLMARHFVKS